MAINVVGDNSPDGNALVSSPSELLNLYGGTPASQRASSNQVTTNIAVSASFGAAQVAVIQEIMNTLTAIGAWKGSA
jgi:hypothetical protein